MEAVAKLLIEFDVIPRPFYGNTKQLLLSLRIVCMRYAAFLSIFAIVFYTRLLVSSSAKFIVVPDYDDDMIDWCSKFVAGI